MYLLRTEVLAQLLFQSLANLFPRDGIEVRGLENMVDDAGVLEHLVIGH